MPLVRIDVLQGFSKAERRSIGDCVQRAMTETLGVPDRDRFQLITEHDADGFDFNRPSHPPFHDDPEQALASLQAVLQLGPHTLHIGHGGPMPAADVKRCASRQLAKRTARGKENTTRLQVVASQSQASEVTWRFVEQIYSADLQPREKGSTDLSNDQLADVADRVGAPRQAQDLIRIGLPIGYDPQVIAAHNLAVLRTFPEPGVPLVVIGDR